MERMSLQRLFTPRLVAFLSLVIPLGLVIFEQTRGMPNNSNMMMETMGKTKRKENTHQDKEATNTNLTLMIPHAAPKPADSPLSDFVRNGNVPMQDRPSLAPLDVLLETYIAQHSEQSLWNDWKANNTDHRVSAFG